MLRRNGRLVNVGLQLFDIAVVVAALPVAYEIRGHLLARWWAWKSPSATYLLILAIGVLSWVTAAWMVDLYQAYRTRSLSLELGRIVRAVALSGAGIGAMSFVAHEQEFSRLFIATYLAAIFVLLTVSRVGLRMSSHALRRRGYNTRNFAVVGSGPKAHWIVETIGAHREWGWKFAGFIVESGASHRGPVLGSISEMSSILERNVLDEVIFATGKDHLDHIERAVAECEEQGVNAKVCVDFFAHRIARTSLEELASIPMIGFSTVPSDPLALFSKHVFDVVTSALLVVLLAPVLFAVAVAIRLDSPGPVLFRQRRVGVNGREFTLLKFRSMRIDAEQQLAALRERNEVSGPVFKMRDDPRVTRVGRFIRRTSLDELPQLFNVLRGEMSVVGPRPPLPSEVKQYERRHRRRLSVKPGITCTWQVSGRSDISFEQWMELDLRYIDSWSLWQDVGICLKTIPAVFTARGAR
jgi:exopolysaccharide biosynthesis polyprenyl glycosylphosphotransferase